MVHKNLLDSKDTLLVVIDIQEKFKAAIYKADKVIEASAKLIQAANILDIPVVYTEQYPKGLGNTVEELKNHLEKAKYFDKVEFSCCRKEGFIDYLKEINRKKVIICGIEAHVCVNQTSLDLLEAGFTPFIVTEAVSSRTKTNKKLGIKKMEKSGAVINSLEMTLFELLETAKNPNFKQVQQLIL